MGSNSKLLTLMKEIYGVKIRNNKINLSMFLDKVLNLDVDESDGLIDNIGNKKEIKSEYYINPKTGISLLRDYNMKKILDDIGEAYKCDICNVIFVMQFFPGNKIIHNI